MNVSRDKLNPEVALFHVLRSSPGATEMAGLNGIGYHHICVLVLRCRVKSLVRANKVIEADTLENRDRPDYSRDAVERHLRWVVRRKRQPIV